jgi:hypothetical protein
LELETAKDDLAEDEHRVCTPIARSWGCGAKSLTFGGRNKIVTSWEVYGRKEVMNIDLHASKGVTGLRKTDEIS